MKKKILSLCMVGALAATAVGGTLAYFTDTDAETNTFTVGKIDITLNEEFDEENANLVPGVDINKDVTITLENGSENSYVWYTYAIPAVLDNDDAGKNIVHVNHAGANWDDYHENSKYWGENQTEANPIEQTWDVDYEVKKGVEIDGIEYNVYSTLYHGLMTADNSTTTVGMTNVYMDTKVDTLKNAEGNVVAGKYTINGETIDYDFSNGVNIIVNAYGIQADGLSDTDSDGDIDVYDAYALYNK